MPGQLMVPDNRRNLWLPDGIVRSGNAGRSAHAAKRRLNALGGTRSLLSKPSNREPPIRPEGFCFSTVQRSSASLARVGLKITPTHRKLSLNLNVGFMTRCNESLEATDAALASDHIYHGALGI